MRTALALVASFGILALGCSSSSSTSKGDGNAADAGAGDSASSVAPDASGASATGDASSVDAAGSGAVCTFNADCPTAERCECSEATGCFCHIGTRGTGKNGVDTCKDGNDCETALCVEGPSSVFYCSGPCTSASGCTGMLPMCIDVAGIGKICTR